MAAYLCNQPVLGLCPCSTSFSSKPFQIQSLQPQILRFPPRPIYASNLASILGFPTTPQRTLFKSFLSSQDSFSSTSDESGKIQNGGRVIDDKNMKPLPSLMVLIEAYKEAILSRDEETVSQIEERIYLTEIEKNKLAQEVSTLSADKVSSKEKHLRLQADFDNFRKRHDKERLNIQGDAQKEVVEKLLLMVDNFERIKQQIKAQTEKEKKIDASYQAIYKQFVEVLRSHQVSVVATVGKPFNPLIHEAIAREKSTEFKEGIIIKECRRGFLLKDQVLRPALVKVSLGPGNRKSPVAPAKSMEQPSTAAGIDER